MSSILTANGENINIKIAIDWELVIINSPIVEFFTKYDLLALSELSKRVRVKTLPYLFHRIVISPNVLLSQPNFFQHKSNFEYHSLSIWDSIKYLSSYHFDKNLAFKGKVIDPFIIQSADTLSRIGPYCKVLVFDQLKNSCYYLIPLLSQFINLKFLFINNCSLPLNLFYETLAKLDKLEGLTLSNIIYFRSSSNNNSYISQNYADNWKILSYGDAKLMSSDAPEFNAFSFAYDKISLNGSIELDLQAVCFPKLELLMYLKKNPSAYFSSFLQLNPQLTSLRIRISQLTPINLNILSSMPNMETLVIESNSLEFQVFEIDSQLSKLKRLKKLTLILSTQSDFSLANQFIKFTPNLERLSVKTVNNYQFEVFNLVVNSLNYFTGSTETMDDDNATTKVYYK